jgi:hypothetical protein
MKDKGLTAKQRADFRVLLQYEFKPIKDEVKRLRKVVESLEQIVESGESLCGRCGMDWGEHRCTDGACPSHDEQGATRIFRDDSIFKPIYS